MGFRCGIVGLPNVGKSTLFNALTRTAAAQAANYPFCTIEPNVGDVGVPDERLDTLARIAGSAQVIPTRLTPVSPSSISPALSAAPRGAKVSATNFSPTSVRSTPSPMPCGALGTMMSPMSKDASILSPTSRP
jgi:hypothetical protein